MVERCIFVVCLDSKLKSETANKENIDEGELNGQSSGDKLQDKPRMHLNGNHSSVDDDDMSEKIQAAHQMLHGCNSENNSGNRWFDKTMQFIISEDGECGINYEHSPAEGIVVIELSEHLFRYM